MKKTYHCLLLTLIVIGLGVQCKKKCSDPANPDCENYDPCYGKKPVSAAFKIQEVVQFSTVPEGWGTTMDTDTITTYGVQFTALEDADTYRWIIGRETLATKSVYRQDFPQGVTYPIQLTVKKKPNLACFPQDDGEDTMTRMMYAGNWMDDSALIGKFKGTVTNPNDTLTIHLAKEPFNSGGIMVRALIPYNWGCRGNDCKYGGAGYAKAIFKKMYFDYRGITEPGCHSPQGIFEIRGKANDTLIINYDELRTPISSERVIRRFVGIRQR